MLKKLFIFSISTSLLLSMPIFADPDGHHHNIHHHDKEKERLKEENEKLREALEKVKKEKSTASKIADELNLFVNKTAFLWASIASIAIGYYGPFVTNHATLPERIFAKLFEGGISLVAVWSTLKYGTTPSWEQEEKTTK